MRFHAMMVVRDEDDVVGQSISDALTWCDGLYVLDTGSNDATWDIVNEMASRDSRVHAILRQPMIFTDEIRGLLFNKIRNRLDHGDWVGWIDGDEFYHVPPPVFLREQVRPHEGLVKYQMAYFRLTQQEVGDYESGRVDIARDRERPIADRRRWYKNIEYGEPRFFRYRRTMQWHLTAPYQIGIPAVARILMRHYPHRDPLQMEKRFRLRSAMMKFSASAGSHWRSTDWRKDLLDITADTEEKNKTEGLASFQSQTSGKLLEWSKGKDLDFGPPQLNHVEPQHKRMLQRVMYATSIPLLDKIHARRGQAFEPRLISNEANRQIGAYTKAAANCKLCNFDSCAINAHKARIL